MRSLALLWAVSNTGVLLTAVQAAAEGADSIDSTFVGPIAGTGIVGIVLLMVIQRWKLMPTYVYDEAKAAWEAEKARLVADLTEARDGLKEANAVYTTQVIPTLTRVLDAERELVDLKRDEQLDRRRRPTGK